MNEKKIGFELLYEGAIKPKIGTNGSAGYDLSIPTSYTEPITVEPGKFVKINTGIAAYMPKGVVLFLYIRSSIGIKRELVIANGTGVIDSDYYGNPSNRGEIILCLRNMSDHAVSLDPGERVAQGVFVPYYLTDEDSMKDDTEFGSRVGGFGSTERF